VIVGSLQGNIVDRAYKTLYLALTRRTARVLPAFLIYPLCFERDLAIQA
jgi:hypothetical protein